MTTTKTELCLKYCKKQMSFNILRCQSFFSSGSEMSLPSTKKVMKCKAKFGQDRESLEYFNFSA